MNWLAACYWHASGALTTMHRICRDENKMLEYPESCKTNDLGDGLDGEIERYMDRSTDMHIHRITKIEIGIWHYIAREVDRLRDRSTERSMWGEDGW